jgi:sulfite reductase alpha subunit-like flavoprotein
MRLPVDPATPVILIGPGTGIAPFRAFAQARRQQHAKGAYAYSCTFHLCRPVGADTLVIFGCRSRTKDSYFLAEWEAAQARGELQIAVAASRDQVRCRLCSGLSIV